MGNRFVKSIICRLFWGFRNLYSTGHTSAPVKTIGSRIGYLYPIYNEKVIVETHHQRVGRYRPHPGVVFRHRVFLSTDICFHVMSLRSIQTKECPSLLVHFRIFCHRHIINRTYRGLRPRVLRPTNDNGSPNKGPHYSRIPFSSFHISFLLVHNF